MAMESMPTQSPTLSQTQPTVRSTAQPVPPRSRAGPVNRCRAAKACRRCNELRVKCDASERGTPCTRCENKNEPECTLIQSRRGIYPRKSRRIGEDDTNTGRSRDKNGPQESNGSSSLQTTIGLGNALDSVSGNDMGIVRIGSETERNVTAQGLSQAETGALSQQNDDTNASEVRQSLASEPPVLAPAATTFAQSTAEDTHGQISSHAEMDWYSQQAPALLADAPPDDISPSTRTDTSTSSYREITWATMFDHLLESHLRGEDVVEKGSITYLGESFPLAIVLEELNGRNGRPRLHHPGPPCPVSEELTLPRDTHPGHMLPEEIIFLEAKKAFESPVTKTLDALVETFLTRVFCLYPIVNRDEFIKDYKAKRIPWILLHALCFISATFCPLKILHQAGYENQDFGHDSVADHREPNAKFASYQIEAMKLTLLLRQIIIARFSPSRPQSQVTSSLTRSLMDWRAQVPGFFSWKDTATADSNILAGSLRVLYNHHMILANLNAPPEGNVRPGFAVVYPNQSLAEETCIIAAQQIASTACAVVVKSDILSAPHELLHGIFIAAVTFYMQTKSTNTMNSQSGRSGLSNCQMVLHESRGAWDPSPWILQLLDKMLGAPQTSQVRTDDAFAMENAAGLTDGSSSMGMNALDSNDMFPTDLDIWQSHPVLGDLFDNMPNMLPLTPNFGIRSGNTPGPNSWTRLSGN
ncbi:hypothetical protein D6D10_09641 [Aureobasidium pullulans]|uniref:Zn(2)-C6 fungal-type domain-containing protein n=1 Tax=Aureobasidium pullulans TaxID=5580 RepID=A0A4V4J528_AURPU|nr:hypothetical protein D6D10_09641 [Aureobasidium pullulans]